jgi:hypothetical protein
MATQKTIREEWMAALKPAAERAIRFVAQREALGGDSRIYEPREGRHTFPKGQGHVILVSPCVIVSQTELGAIGKEKAAQSWTAAESKMNSFIPLLLPVP